MASAFEHDALIQAWHCRELEKHFDLKNDESVEYANEEVGAPGTRCNDKILIFTNYTRYKTRF